MVLAKQKKLFWVREDLQDMMTRRAGRQCIGYRNGIVLEGLEPIGKAMITGFDNEVSEDVG